MTYEFLEHTADLKVSVIEKTIEEAFVSSALAMKEAICGKIKVETKVKKKIEVKGKDHERLLYEFLEQILYLLDAEDFLTSGVESLKIEEGLDGYSLKAVFLGDKASNYKFSNDVKAITYNDMIIGENSKGKMVVQFVLDV